MPTITLSGQLPQDPQHNSLLDRWEQPLVDNAEAGMLIALVVIDVPKVTYVTEDALHRPTIRLRRIEAIGWADSPEGRAAVAEIARLSGSRLGEPLPTEPDEGGVEVYATGPEDAPERARKLRAVRRTTTPGE